MIRPAASANDATAGIDVAPPPANFEASNAVRHFVLPALTPGWFTLLLAALVCAAYPEVVLGTHTFFYRDYAQFGYPLAWYLKESLWHGEIPLWNPYNNCGLPFLAQWNTMSLYPPSLFYVLLPLPWALGVFNLLHLVLGGLGMYFLSRRWTANDTAAGVAGAAFAFSGLSMHCLMWPNNLAALGWMPWVVWLVERGWSRGGTCALTGGVVTALQFLAGAPEITIFTWIIVIAMFAGGFCQARASRSRLVGRAGVMALLLIGLTAAQSLPFIELALHSQRNREFGGDTWAMPEWGWANLVVPMFRCTPSRLGVFSQDDQQWTSSYYSGIGVLALALMALWFVRRPIVWFLGATAFGGLVLALGKNGYVHSSLREVFPLLGFIRFPIKFVVLTAFALPLLAAFGLNGMQRASRDDRASVRTGLAGIGVFLTLTIATILVAAGTFPIANESFERTLISGLSRLALLAVVLLGVWFSLSFEIGRRWIGLAIVVTVSLDGLTHMPRQNPTVPVETYGPVNLEMSAVPRLGEARAMITPATQRFLENASASTPIETLLGQRRTLFSDCNLIERVPKVNGFYSLYLKEEADVRTLLYQTTNAFIPGLAGFLGVSQISSRRDLFAWAAQTSLPLVTAGQKPVYADAPDTLKGLASPEFDPRLAVYLPREAENLVSAVQATNVIVVSRLMAAHCVELEVSAEAPVMVVLAQAFYHPWSASVDGRPAKLWRANHAFQAIEIPAGLHQIQVSFRDWSFRVGGVVTALSLLVCTLQWIRIRRKDGLAHCNTPRPRSDVRGAASIQQRTETPGRM